MGYDAFNSAGKGIIFPRTDITLVQVDAINPNNQLYDLEGGGVIGAKTYYDGLVVFNTGTGSIPANGMGTSASPVSPGFYYYRNTGTDWNTGVWMPLGGGASTSVKSKTVTDVVADGVSATLNLGTSVITENEVVEFLGAKVYNAAGDLVIEAFSDYEKATNILATGNGMMYQVLPEGTYKVLVEYK